MARRHFSSGRAHDGIAFVGHDVVGVLVARGL
jgi:hypothetical protein